MKKFFKILVSFLCASLIAVPSFFAVACGDNSDDDKQKEEQEDNTPAIEPVDYVKDLHLDFNSKTKKQEVKVKLYVDGDTTHFWPQDANKLQYTDDNSADFAATDGYIKARYLAINTPESTGKIEKWGKAASKFTHTKLENAKTIVIESDDEKWNVDSTGERYLLWIWYLNEGETEFRNLNVEILQEGLAIASGTANGIYGETAMAALNQAKALKLKVHDPDSIDEDFYEGDAIPITLKELRCHLDEVEGKKVQVTGIVVAQFNNSVYIEEFDPEVGICFGMAIYYGYGANSALLDLLEIGNEVSLVGTVSYYEGGDSFQISGLSYDKFDKTNPDNSSLVSTGNSATFTLTEASDIVSGKIDVYYEIESEDDDETETEKVTLDYGEAIMNTTVTVSNLKVISAYTTSSSTSSNGAISLTCQAPDGTTITVRTEPLKDASGNLITQDEYLGKTITAKGIIEKYNGNYQVKVWRADNISIVG